MLPQRLLWTCEPKKESLSDMYVSLWDTRKNFLRVMRTQNMFLQACASSYLSEKVTSMIIQCVEQILWSQTWHSSDFSWFMVPQTLIYVFKSNMIQGCVKIQEQWYLKSTYKFFWWPKSFQTKILGARKFSKFLLIWLMWVFELKWKF